MSLTSAKNPFFIYDNRVDSCNVGPKYIKKDTVFEQYIFYTIRNFFSTPYHTYIYSNIKPLQSPRSAYNRRKRAQQRQDYVKKGSLYQTAERTLKFSPSMPLLL